jgi:hypothetical protein
MAAPGAWTMARRSAWSPRKPVSIMTDESGIPYPPTHPKGQHGLEQATWPSDELAEEHGHADPRVKRALRQEVEAIHSAPEGFPPEKWAAMNRAERRAWKKRSKR